MGHIGYTPQFKKKFKIEGQTKKRNLKTFKRSKINRKKAGAFSIVLECLSPKAAKLITNKLKIPTIGIGSSNCDGQILVTDDMLGISGFYPKFVKKYVNLNRIIEKAVKKYTRDVKLKKISFKKKFFKWNKI